MNCFRDKSGTLKGTAFLFRLCYGASLVLLTLVIVVSIVVSYAATLPVNAISLSRTNTIKKTIYHAHTGSSSGGGCYSVARSGTRSYDVPCGGSLHYWGDSWGTSECTNCGASYFGDRGGESCPHSTTVSESYTYYELGCGKSTDTILGYVTYHIDTFEWAKEVHVTVSIENIGMQLSDKPYSMNGEAYENGEFTITENGVYDFGIIADSNSATSAAGQRFVIDNIDHTAPTVMNYSLSPTDWVKEGVTLTIDEIKDLQPDGSQGCGIPECPISYDGGANWTDDYEHFYENNGDYTVLIRDNLDNTYELKFTISNIDHEPPNIVSFEYDDTKNIRETRLTIEVNDILSDGREGVGLEELPISYDGGKTWTDSRTIDINHNRTINLVVRDKLGNMAYRDAVIDNIDDYAPTVSHLLYPGYWTNGDVKVIFDARDVNGDGSEGIGLPDECYSYDSGNSWTSENTVTVSENTNVAVAVRDKNDNIAYYSVEVINIDRIPPVITASWTLSEDKRSAVLIADGSDSQSGIDYSSFAWEGNGMTLSGQAVCVSEDGIYTVTGRDKAGNTASATVNVSGIKHMLIEKIAGKETKENNRPAIRKSSTIKIKEGIADKKTSVQVKELTDNGSKSLWDRLKDAWNNLDIIRKIMLLILLAAIIAGILFLLYLWYRSVAILNEREEDNYDFMGMKYIGKRDGVYIVKVPDSIFEKLTTTHVRFRYNRLFAFIHKHHEVMYLFTGNKRLDGEIELKNDIMI